MFGSDILEVAIGIAFVYLLLSLLCTALREGLEAMMKSRATDLERGIKELLRNETLTAALYNHPLINGLYNDRYGRRDKKTHFGLPRPTNLPSYIPARNFAQALLDMTVRGLPDTEPSANKTHTPAAAAGPNAAPITLANVRAGIRQIGNADVQRVILTALDTADNDLAAAQANLEAWYNSSMDRVSGWYKRRTQTYLFGLGLVTTVAANVNTITIATYLYQNRPAREAIVKTATIYADSAPRAAGASGQRADSAGTGVVRGATADIAGRYQDLAALGLPIGWDNGWGVPSFGAPVAPLWNDIAAPILGWLLTALAVTLGAPFWFDLLNKFMVIRSTVKPHEKSLEEGSEDRQPSQPGAAGPGEDGGGRAGSRMQERSGQGLEPQVSDPQIAAISRGAAGSAPELEDALRQVATIPQREFGASGSRVGSHE